MKLTPDDILSRVFSNRILGGYPKQEVASFLERVAREMQDLLEERRRLLNQVREKENQLCQYKDREDLLRESITTAQKTASRIEEEARDSAAKIVQEARQKGDFIVQDARDSLKTVYQDLSDLRRVHVQLKNTLKAVLQSHQDLLEQDPVHTLLPQMGAGEEEIENKFSQTLSELSKSQDLL